MTHTTPGGHASRLWAVIIDNSLLLLGGAIAALVWANLDHDSYDRFAHPLHFLVNDIGMVFFFALAAKEVFEATLPGGALASPRRAAVPLLAAAGGMAAPALIYVAIVVSMRAPELTRGWAIPCATDIAFSYLTARVIFGARHPAIPFLLLLAIADDALGLMILAVFYPTGEVSPLLFAGMLVPALALAWWLRRRATRSFWPYVLIAGSVSWVAFFKGGFHPALALVPIVPLMPHESRDLGIFAPGEELRLDTLNRFEHWWKLPVQIILFFFGLVNAGVSVSSTGLATWAVLTGLLVGKPLGIVLATAAGLLAGLSLPKGLASRDLLVLGMAAAIGFTVALFFATAAFPGGSTLDEAKMGALLSFAAAPIAIGLGWILRIRRLS
jgi:NhaA family Na+:H+ antiporter